MMLKPLPSVADSRNPWNSAPQSIEIPLSIIKITYDKGRTWISPKSWAELREWEKRQWQHFRSAVRKRDLKAALQLTEPKS